MQQVTMLIPDCEKVEHQVMPRGLRSLESPEGGPSRYESPPASELQRLMWTKKGSESHHMDQVQSRIYLGDMRAAKDKRSLQAHRISHVLNAAHGKFNVNTGAAFYRDTKITYHGVEAFDMVTFNLTPFFYPAADFIKRALGSPTGGVLVHCAMGLSRSATLVLAYLMIHERMTLPEAIKAVSANRNISPNAGFLQQLRELDNELQRHQGVGRCDVRT
ncbi:dual specificity protein phosphatase 13B-like isoform X1 [Nerophis ophidion]|uniref:dual specificity protein phosphatase 13B-like isoform X1 n=3 Tax=Nerophis ophidion TaxID=159077 RepID=UPI002ADF9B80|nr:dual specificity protein phosphatase 13B-like isoform X1 [Nerophis ophidion]